MMPFPGMNPYMEAYQLWAGVHLHMLANIAQQLAPQLRPRYRVHTERYLSIGSTAVKFRPDMTISQSPSGNGGVHPVRTATTDATVITENLPYPDEDVPPHLEIIADNGEVVTIIEVLSPTNKQAEHKNYLNKRYQVLKTGINLIEIDLLREGQRVAAAQTIDSPYACVISLAREWPKARVWAVTWSEPCPVLPVPLRAGEPDVPLAVQHAVEAAYAVEFDGFVDYAADPPGALTAAWRAEIQAIIAGEIGPD